ncbi:hypothetical protein Lepto7375DRAFT_8231 [Leptolyngbya sp. PCC 7375]|nr:hypothetical protein Lepto7375DRAFT_8231 [Leptolyngbya sp. PCC 7375]
MSAYMPPSYNRLLALENHIRPQQPRVRPSRQRSPVRQRRRQTRELLQAPAQRQDVSSPMGYKPLTQRLGEPPARRQSRLKQPQPRYYPELTAPNPALQTPRQPQTQQPAGPYRQLAAQLGQRYYTPSQTHTIKSDLPTISTPINPTIVETFEATPTTIAQKHRRQTLNSLQTSPPWAEASTVNSAEPCQLKPAPPWAERQPKSAPPSPPSTKQPPKPQPTAPLASYKSLATSIRQARLGLSAATSEPTTPVDKRRSSAMNWAIDEVFTTEADASPVELNHVVQQEVVEVESTQQSIVRETIALEDSLQNSVSDLPLENYSGIAPDHEHPAQSDVPSIEIQVIEIFSDNQDQSPCEAMPPEEVLSEDDIPASAATIDIVPVVTANDTVSEVTPPSPPQPIENKSTTVPKTSPDVSQQAHEKSVTTVTSATDTTGLCNNVLLLTYQLACPPQLVSYMAQLQRKRHKRKRSPAAGRSSPHQNAS